ncbi:MAG TPA: hypothetical protein PK400_02180 [Phycisphaerales bacterium]|nr:hypothetical protein [Phycisphaerales bacterium]
MLMTQPTFSGSRHVHRAGLAMLLVLISLATATILGMAYLSSRDNSAAVGNNVASAAAARWAAASGVDLAVAIMESEADWRTLHSNGRLLTNFPIAGATVDIDVVDVETGTPPTADTRYVNVQVTATTGGVQQTALAAAEVMPPKKRQVAVDLSEFAIFGAQQIRLANNSTLTRWPQAPTTELGYRLAVGSQAVAALSVEVLNNATMVDTTIFHSTDASESLVGSTEQKRTRTVNGIIPMPAPPPPGDNTSGTFEGGYVISNASEVVTIANRRITSSTLQNTSRLTLRGNITRTIRGDLTITGRSKLIIDGHAKLIVFGNLVLNEGFIELTPNSTLEIYVRGNVTVTNGFIGEQRADLDYTRDVSGRATYMNTSRVRLWGIPNPDSPRWLFDQRSAIKGSLYAPDAGFRMTHSSALYGRAAFRAVSIENTACLYYDPNLDTRNGYTNPQSPLFEADGNVKTEIRTLGSLSTAEVTNLADSLGLEVKVGDLLIGTVVDADTSVPADQPTPRPRKVNYKIIAWGVEMPTIEGGAPQQ